MVYLLKMVIFHGYARNNQRVNPIFSHGFFKVNSHWNAQLPTFRREATAVRARVSWPAEALIIWLKHNFNLSNIIHIYIYMYNPK